jgi:hypothetical protein
MTPRITSLRTHPRDPRRDAAILDLLELLELDMVPGFISSAQLRDLWRVSCRETVHHRLREINRLPGWRVEIGRGCKAQTWIGPRLAAAPEAAPPSPRERWQALRRRLG